MKKIIIFDFNRTLYDPDGKALVPGALSVLKKLRKRSFVLYLISHAAPSREHLITALGLDQLFSKIIISYGKRIGDFRNIIDKNTSLDQSFVVGDRIRKEITIGNRLGMRTVWLKSGKFEGEEPRNENERPDFIIEKIESVLKIIT